MHPHAVAVIFSALCLSGAFAADVDFGKAYSAFGEAPSADVRPVAEKLVAIVLMDFELDAKNVFKARELLNDALEAAGHPRLSLIAKGADENYQTPIRIPKANRTVGEVINLLCEQANLQWDFSGSKLTFKPRSAEQVAAPDA